MVAKTIKVSEDGTNFYTLPGNTGEFQDEAGALDDTIFGQNFKSGQPNLINWSIEANALYKGFAGYSVDIKKSGTSTSFTTEAMTQIGSTKSYRITDATKNMWDVTGTFNVFDNAVNANDEVESIDYLFGIVTFLSSYTVTGPVTVTGAYLPITTLAKYRNFTLTQTQDPIDDTDIPTAQANNGHRTMEYGLKTVELETSGVYDSANGYRDSLVDRETLIIEINPDGNLKSRARGFFKPSTRGQQGNIGALEEETAKFTLFVPSTSNLLVPFRWDHASDTTLSTAVKICLDAWEDETTIDAQYLPDGSTGLEGEVIISDISLSGGLEAMNEFKVSLQGTGEVTTV